MKFPKRIKYRGRVLATIYGKCKGRDSYRVAWQVAGQRRMASFPSYSLAKRHADGLVKDLAKGSQVTALHPAQARDALAALERLADFYRATGRRVSLLAGISEFVEASAKLHGRTLGEAVEGYLAHRRQREAQGHCAKPSRNFSQADAPRTKAADGQRAQLSANYAYNRKLQLRRFAATFPDTAVCDLSKEHLDTFIGSLARILPQIAQPLPRRRRQFPAMGSPQRLSSPARTACWKPTACDRTGEHCRSRILHAARIAALLERARNQIQSLAPVIAIGGLAGLPHGRNVAPGLGGCLARAGTH